MGTLYLIDAHNPTLLSSKINDTVNLQTGDSHSVRGSFPVNLPFDIPMDGAPTDVSELITKKYQGILTIYPGYTHILYDEQIDATGWDTTASSGYTLGERQTNSVRYYINGRLTSSTQTLASTPDTCVVRYEAFKYIETDPATGQYTRRYQDISDSVDAFFEVSFDDGFNYFRVFSGVLLNIPLSARGNQFKVRFYFGQAEQVYLGSWAIIY